MKIFSAMYKGDRFIELLEDIDLPEDIQVLVVIPGQEGAPKVHNQLQVVSTAVFAKLWDNEEDEIWNEYL